MYRDFIGKPEKLLVDGDEYWYQEVGDTILLYDCNGDPVAEFDSFDALERYLFEE